jgi:hypothetical protein
VLVKFAKMIVTVKKVFKKFYFILIYLIERGQCFEGKCYCIPGFEGEACEFQTKPHSVVECASQCVDVCLKKCTDHQILCYTKCSDDCNKSCLESTTPTSAFRKKNK